MSLSYPFSATFRNHLLPVGSQGHALDIPGSITMKPQGSNFLPEGSMCVEAGRHIKNWLHIIIKYPQTLYPMTLVASFKPPHQSCLSLALGIHPLKHDELQFHCNIQLCFPRRRRDFSENWRLRRTTRNPSLLHATPLFTLTTIAFPAGFPGNQPIQVLSWMSSMSEKTPKLQTAAACGSLLAS